MKRGGFTSRCLIIGTLFITMLLPSVSGAPEIRPSTQIMDTVNPLTDNFTFPATGTTIPAAAQWTVRSPSGDTATITLTNPLVTPSTETVTFQLDGTQIAGPVGNWVWSGDLTGTAAAGTWTIQLSGLNYESTKLSAGFSPAWNQVTSPTTQDLKGVGGTYAVGDGGVILERVGGTWTQVTSPVSTLLRGVSGPYAVGVQGNIMERISGVWTPVAALGSGITFYDVTSEGYAVGASGVGGVIAELSGATWSLVTSPTATEFTGVSGENAGGSSFIERVGGTWSTASSTGAPNLWDVDGTYAVGVSGEIWERVGGTWTQVTSPVSTTIRGVSGTYAVGDGGVILERVGGTWTQVTSPVTSSLSAVNGTYAVGDGGVILERTAPVFIPSRVIEANLTVSSKSISYGFASDNPQTLLQFWNQHITTSHWNETSTSNKTDVSMVQDPPDEAPDEDPNESRFYNDALNMAPEEPLAVTAGQEVSCPNQLEITGAWFRGPSQSFETYGYFTYIPGFYPANTDLSQVAGTTTTTSSNLGGGQNGTHSVTIPYDNPMGVSYQFTAQDGPAGNPQNGLTLYSPPEQCNENIPTITGGVNLNRLLLRMTASQAQCSGDPVGFTIVEDLTGSLITNGWALHIIRNSDDAVVEVIDVSDFHSAVDGFYWIEDEYPTGTYTAAFIGTGVAGLIRIVDAVSFNVPEGTCKDEPVTIDIGNVTIEVDTFLLQEILNVTTNTNEGALLVNNMDFETLGFDGFLILVLLLIILAWSLWQGYTFLGLVAAIGSALTFFDVPGIGFAGIIYLLIIGYLLEYFLGGFRRLKTKNQDQDGNPW